MKLTDNTVLITGGTAGIGRGLAERFHAHGNTVIIAGRRRELLESITAAHPGMGSVVLDVGDPVSVRRCLRRIGADHPELNVLINNAGIMLREDLADPKHVEVAEQTVATNLLGPIRMVNAFLPILVENPDATVINVTSGRAFVPLPVTPTYSATKAAIHSYTQSLRAQITHHGVEVLELVPPRVQTEMMDQLHDPDAMPLAAFLDEVMEMLASPVDSGEICPAQVRPVRFAEADGNYADALAAACGVR